MERTLPYPDPERHLAGSRWPERLTNFVRAMGVLGVGTSQVTWSGAESYSSGFDEFVSWMMGKRRGMDGLTSRPRFWSVIVSGRILDRPPWGRRAK